MRFFAANSAKNQAGKKSAFATLAVFLFAFALMVPSHAHASISLNPASIASTGLTTADLPRLVGNIISAFLGLLGTVLVVLIMYAGFLWMTAQGDDEKIKQAKAILRNAVIGMIIIVCSYAIVRFIINALIPGSTSGVSGGGAGAPVSLNFANRGADQLGNGVIEYHYPEPGQTDVVRNTKISVTFKKPVKLSTVFLNYDDKNTFDTSDDLVCASGNTCATGTPMTANTRLALNTANVRLIANNAMAAAGSGTLDQQFDNRYPVGAAVAAKGRYTAVPTTLVAGQQQTIVFTPDAYIGSATDNVNYRVALRGGDNGIKLWSMPTSGGTAPVSSAAFTKNYPDGGYYWSFVTGTVIDTTPPKIVAVVPVTEDPPGSSESGVLDRNQLLQIYFSEAIDPTVATGVIGTGAGAGFSNVQVQAVCLPGSTSAGLPSNRQCVSGSYGTTASVNGTVSIGNRNQTLEFAPSTACENVSMNSCGEKVYCLPKNVKLTVRALAASVGTGGPTAIAGDGIVDMADNSLDGNGDGTAQGRRSGAQPGGLADEYYRNSPQTTPTNDSSYWEYHVGSNVDLVPPFITSMDPIPTPAGQPAQDYVPNKGPQRVPANLVPKVVWSKTMSVTAARTARFDEVGDAFQPDSGTLALRANECKKDNPSQPCKVGTRCPCTDIEAPGFFVDLGIPQRASNGTEYTVLSFLHPLRPFYTANDLGYTDADQAVATGNIPKYVPVVRAQFRDTKQNCFWPSKYQSCNTSTSGSAGNPAPTSCCNTVASPDGTFLTTCAPL